MDKSNFFPRTQENIGKVVTGIYKGTGSFTSKFGDKPQVHHIIQPLENKSEIWFPDAASLREQKLGEITIGTPIRIRYDGMEQSGAYMKHKYCVTVGEIDWGGAPVKGETIIED